MILGHRTKIPQAVQCGQIEKKQNLKFQILTSTRATFQALNSHTTVEIENISIIMGSSLGLTDLENELTVAGGEGIVREFGMDMYTLLY